MNHNKLEHAEELKRTYGEHYVASQNTATLKNIIARYEGGTDQPIHDRLSDFMRTRGPFLQALDLPRQSETPWAEFADSLPSLASDAPDGLHEDIIRTFSQAGFKRLYAFQEDTAAALLDDNHTLVTAGTGRGKTESWLIPILQYICEAKAGYHDAAAKSVKCVLTYPTKALAQDQLKRLIEYLSTLNETRSGTDRITVGIFDGDTPHNDPDAYSYLNTSFKYFNCPCSNCSSSLMIERVDDGYQVTHDSSTDMDIDLGFIQLTREEIIDAKVDILLTNPDTVNYRLFNINEQDEQEVFITEPKYIVFDEIHEYSELFGSFTATLMRRYIRSRRSLLGLEESKEDDLRLVGASATVENKRAVFQRINPFTDADIKIVEENPRALNRPLPENVPGALVNSSIGVDRIRDPNEKRNPADSLVTGVLEYHSEDWDLIDQSHTVGDQLYDILLEEVGDDLEIMRALYTVLREETQRPTDLRDSLQEMYDLTEMQSRILVDNFITLGQLSGVLESRAHLFSWPLDGYYTCINCAAVYDTPQSSCTQCNHHFVTKLAYCNHCGEEALESWFCPDCERLTPLSVTSSEGRFEYFNDYSCNCGADTIRTIWRPYYECSNCNSYQKIDRITHCPDCGDVMPLSDDQSELVCRNPNCETTIDADTDVICESCHSHDLEPLTDDSILYCEDCGDTHEQTDRHQCNCGGVLRPKRYLGWSCGDSECSAVYFGEPPNSCECGKRRFARTGLLDINTIDHCTECDTDLLPGAECKCESPDISPMVRGFKEYKLVDEHGYIRKPSSFHGAVPCYDPQKTYHKSSRYESMIRGPGNTAVTTAQYFLRKIADVDEPSRFGETKMLSFADSQSDMKELNRNFTEPEQSLFITQLIINSLENEGWTTLKDLQRMITERSKEYEEMLTEGNGGLLENMTGYRQSVEDFISDEVAARVLRGRYNNRWRSHDHLPSDGLIDVTLDIDWEALEDGERAVLMELNKQSKQYVESLIDKIDDARHHVDSLINTDTIRRFDTDSGYLIGLDEESVLCTTVDNKTPTTYVPTAERFRSTFDDHCNQRMPETDYVVFTADYRTRSEFSHPHFDIKAYRANYSDPLMLVSRAYFGLTEKDDRRRIEYQFREGRYPNFLSSGPAMEVGMDIGDLDALLLYGTPPNTNSYLQRIGRAGRQSGSSLVHSISQRNPIDYYYYERPNQLIQAEPQPVPLNETNDEVFRTSLTWAILDYFASEYWIPWRRESSDVIDQIYCDEDLVPRAEPRPNDIVTFTALLASENEEIQYIDDDAPLQTLKNAYESHRPEVRAWLEDVLGFSYCRTCGKKHNETYEGSCSEISCDGSVVSAVTEHKATIEEAMEAFINEFVEGFLDFEDDIIEELEGVQQDLNELTLESRGRHKRRRKESTDRAEQRDQRDRLQNRSANLNQYLDRLDRMDYGAFLEEHSTTPLSLRSVGDTVKYELIGEDFESVTDDLQSRQIRVALSELHPGAAYLHSDNERYIVTGVRAHSYQTSQLHGNAAICPTCGVEYEFSEGPCDDCGTQLARLRTIVPDRVTAYKSDLVLGQLPNGETLRPTRVYQSSNSNIQSTYAPTETNVTKFEADPERSFNIETNAGDVVGRLDHGDVTIQSSVRQFYAHYAGGGSDPIPNVFELCGKENCDGIIARDDDTAYCMRHPEHSTDETNIVKLATEFETKSVRIQFDNKDIEHAFSHGIRMALQYIGGVGVRAIPESLDEDGTYVFDNEAGGSGITVLLTIGSGDTREKFDTAVDLIEDAFECDCDNGCPFCIYQYGCENQNDPDTIGKTDLMELIDAGLTLTQHNIKTDDEE